MKAPLLLMLSIATLGLAACAGTSAPPPAAAPQGATETHYRTQSQAEAAAADDDLICRNEAVVGSRFPKKTCATRAEWEAARATAQDEVRRNQKGTALPRSN